MPNWAADRVKDSCDVTREGALGGGVALVGELPQGVAVDGDVGELLGHEVARRRRQREDQHDAQADAQGGAHAITTRVSGRWVRGGRTGSGQGLWPSRDSARESEREWDRMRQS